jgi:hypothetical protein
MSYYFKYDFISPEMVYSTVKEELKSYFDTGAVDDLMFPTYLDKCLRKLGRTTYVISETPLEIQDFEARLPDNFYAVREAWMCTEIPQYPYQTANSFYSQAATENTIQVSPVISNGVPCTSNCPPDNCTCMPDLIQAVYKTNHQMTRSYKKSYLLKPGNISARNKCEVDYTDAWRFTATNPLLHEFTPGSAGYDSFDIRDNKFVTNFRNGIVHLIFYAYEFDGSGNQMVPDNFRIREYIEAFIKYKVFETLANQINDETFDQLQKKLGYYKQLSEEAFIMADIEIKKQDVWAKQRRIKQDLNRFNMYELPNRVSRNWRRNN